MSYNQKLRGTIQVVRNKSTTGIFSLNIFYCNFLHVHLCNGVGPQVFPILVTALPLSYRYLFLALKCESKLGYFILQFMENSAVFL